IGRNVTSMPACSQISRGRFICDAVSTQPIGVVEMAVLGSGDWLDVLNGAQPPIAPFVAHTSIGWITAYLVTVTAACALLARDAIVHAAISKTIRLERCLQFLIVRLPFAWSGKSAVHFFRQV